MRGRLGFTGGRGTRRPGRLRGPGRRPEDDRGAVAILVAALLVVFLGLAALVVDLGYARDQTRVAQNAADAGALAAATCMASLTSGCNNTAAATQKAQSYITANGWDAAGSTINFNAGAQTVSVTLPARQEPTFFAAAINHAAPAVARSAVATWNGASSGCSLCVLNNLTLQANADLTMDQGNLLVNGNLDVGPNARVQVPAGRIFVNGSVTGNTNGLQLSDITGLLGLGALPKTGPITPPVVPLSGWLGQPVTTPASNACVAGTYSSIGNCRTFGSGVYVLTGLSSFSGNTNIQATGVMFVLTCSSTTAGVTRSSTCNPAQSGGSIEVKGGATVRVSVGSTPINASICFGLAIVSDPNNTGGVLVNGNGNGNNGSRLTVDGSVYLRSGTLTYGGGPDLTVNGNVIVGTYAGNGNTGIVHAQDCNSGAGPVGGGVHLLQ